LNDSLTANAHSARSPFISLIEAFCEAASWTCDGRGRSMTTETATMTINASVARTQVVDTRRLRDAQGRGRHRGRVKRTFSKPERSSVTGQDYRRSRDGSGVRRRLDALREYKPSCFRCRRRRVGREIAVGSNEVQSVVVRHLARLSPDGDAHPVGGPDVIERVDAPESNVTDGSLPRPGTVRAGLLEEILVALGSVLTITKWTVLPSAPSSCDASCISAPSTGRCRCRWRRKRRGR